VLTTLARDYTLGSLAALHPLVSNATGAARAPSPKPLLAITFDDGQQDNFEHARPVLARHGVRATFFVPVEALESGVPLWHDRLGFAAMALAEGRGGVRARERVESLGVDPAADRLPARLAERAKRLSTAARKALTDELLERTGAEVPAWAGMMRPAELRLLAAEGHEVGSHTMTHPILPRCDDAQVRFEVVESKRRLERIVGRSIESFCYPNGDWDRRALDALAGAGYARAVTTAPGLGSRRTPPFLLPRHDIDAARLRDRRGALSPAILAWRLRARLLTGHHSLYEIARVSAMHPRPAPCG
jgi:peptidoglycan/xylan/chitin deacetylase (PgdA/CDA1 family)